MRDGAAWLTLNREARRNAISMSLIDLFFEALDRAESDAAVRLLCITSAGDRAFCSGADLSGPGAEGGGDIAEGPRKYARLLTRLAEYPKPLLARLNGHCLAGGMGLMLACDIVYAREDVKIGTPEVKVGMFPMMIGALIFRNAVRKKVLEMIYTGELVTARQAEAMGLITRTYPTTEAMDQSVRKTSVAIGSRAPLAIGIGRRALAKAQDMDLDRALDYLSDRLVEVLKTEDAAEGLSAFIEKREPKWKGL